MKLAVIIVGLLAYAAASPVDVESDPDVDGTTMPPIGPTTASIITVEPASGSTQAAPTIGPGTASTEAAPTVAPISGSTNTAITVGPGTGITNTAHTINPVTGSTGPATLKPASTRGFDGGSFAGGIALGLGVCIIAIVAYKLYARRKNKGYSNM